MIEREIRDGVSVLRMAHGKANALDLSLTEGLDEALALEVEGEGRAAVLTGTGGIFSAGVDLVRLLDGGPERVARFVAALREMIWRLLTHPKPLIAAVNGHAIAGGCILACGCDYRVMAEGKGRIGVPELLVGVPFPTAALETLRMVTPAHLVQSTVFRGQAYLPDEARSRGLVDELAPPESLLGVALDRARAMAAVPTESFRVTKAQLRAPVLERIRAAEADGTEDAVAAAWSRPETLAAIREYVRKTLGK